MEPESPASAPNVTPAVPPASPSGHLDSPAAAPFTKTLLPPETRGLGWIFLGDEGLRAGWSIAIFAIVFGLILSAITFLMLRLHPASQTSEFSPVPAMVSEIAAFAALLAAACVAALAERRSMMAYNLSGPRKGWNLLSGLAAGFVALSALVGLMAAGGWLHFGGVALSGAAVLKYGALWGFMFLLVGCFEEGLFRCYLQATLTRGLNFWWALGIVALICLFLATTVKGSGAWGVYAAALLGAGPCFYLHWSKAKRSGFWQAAWLTSMGFGFIHTGNSGENWIGIFAAAGIGFVFCVSIRLTGSAWWAIGCHAAWDWAETFFYGTADSGMAPRGHLLNTAPAGPALWSGGADGPEGSILVLAVIALLLAALIAQYGRKRQTKLTAQTAEPVAG